jgi:hypothetical protein
MLLPPDFHFTRDEYIQYRPDGLVNNELMGLGPFSKPQLLINL